MQTGEHRRDRVAQTFVAETLPICPALGPVSLSLRVPVPDTPAIPYVSLGCPRMPLLIPERASAAFLRTLCLTACAWACLAASTSRAQSRHTVRPGQTLAAVAKRYNRSAHEIAAENGLRENATLRRGQVLKVPSDRVVFVAEGQTLSSIAHEHGTGYLALAEANHLAPDAPLSVGQRLALPEPRGSAGSSAKPSAGTTTQDRLSTKLSATTQSDRDDPSPGKPKRGVVTLHRLMSGETLSLRLVDDHGRAKLLSRLRMREFLRPRDSRKRKMPNARLIELLARVSDHFGGRPIHVVSGYRLPGGLTRKTSRHVAGEAIDFRIPGVPLETLRDYCSQFKNVGVGIYPRTQFIHLDVRKAPARWTDWSEAGQPALLEKPSTFDESPAVEAVAADNTADENPAGENAEALKRALDAIPSPTEAEHENAELGG